MTSIAIKVFVIEILSLFSTKLLLFVGFEIIVFFDVFVHLSFSGTLF